jgi:RND superfamily putative drug exporter
MRALARWCIAHRRAVVVAWLVALVAANAIGQAVGSTYNSNYRGPSNAGSQRAIDLLTKSFPARRGDSASIVFDATGPSGVRGQSVQREITTVLARISTFPHITGVVSPYTTAHAISADGHIAYAGVLFDKRSFALPTSSIKRVINTAEGARTPTLHVQLAGQPIEQVQPPNTGPATIVGILAAMVVLLITFGTVVAAGLPLIAALLALGTAIGLIALLTHALDVVNFTPQLAAMIGLGVGIDYSLFVVTRYRAGLDSGLEPDEAIVTAMDTSGRAVMFAGVTVVIAMLGQLLVGVSFLRGPAIGSSLTVLLTMIAALTLLPAVLSKLGRGIDRWDPFRLRQRTRSGPGFWERWAGMIQRHPLIAALASLAVLLVLASPILGLRLGATDAGTDAKSTTTRQAYDLLAKGFGPGFNGPMQIVAKLPPAGGSGVVATLRAGLVGQPDVAAVEPAVYSPNGQLAVINVFPKTAPRDAATSTLLSRLRDKVIPPLERSTKAVVYVGGTTAIFADFSSLLASKLPLFIGAVVLISALLLLVVFRSVFVALKAIAMNLLSVAAAFGVVVAIFQWGWLGGVIGISTTSPIAAFLPVMVFAIVFGLSMDYEVFLMSRMHEEWERTGDAAHAMRHGLAATGRVITAAAAIMVFVFGSFILGDSLTIKLFGVGLASAVFLDAFLIRTVLVPALMALMGPRAWWLPRGLDRALPRVNVDPSLHDPAPEPA